VDGDAHDADSDRSETHEARGRSSGRVARNRSLGNDDEEGDELDETAEAVARAVERGDGASVLLVDGDAPGSIHTSAQ
jgi:hypothetical protein